MRKTMAVALSVLTTWFLFSPASLVTAIEPSTVEETAIEGIVQTIEGSIDTVDAEKKIVTVRWMVDPVMMHYENVTLKVLPSTALVKNSSPIELRDIESGDHATVRYDPNTAPIARALSIDIEE